MSQVQLLLSKQRNGTLSYTEKGVLIQLLNQEKKQRMNDFIDNFSNNKEVMTLLI